MLAHHTVTGCNMAVGDLLGSGTISDHEDGTKGSLLEMSQGGKFPIELSGGETRLFLNDGDSIKITGYAGDQQSGLVGFGDCIGEILPPL